MAGAHHAPTVAVRRAVRAVVRECAPGDLVVVALSGGADSTALAAAAALEGSRCGVAVGAVIVDHGLRRDSATVGQAVADRALGLGLRPVDIVPVTVVPDGDGLEAAARTARYAALEAAAARLGARLVLLGHTRDDQAEQVLLGLARGSGTRSLAGMPPARGILRRPLLGIGRAQTRAFCEAAGLPWWDDPMNEDPAFTRVRARRAIADLERDLGPGIAAALARSADQLRQDADHLDALADAALPAVIAAAPTAAPESGVAGSGTAVGVVRCAVDVAAMSELPRPIRTRVWRRLLIAAGAPGGEVGARHTDACDRLLTHWRGQGPLHVPGDLRVRRRGDRVLVRAADGER